MERYGIDRPDLRFGLELHDVSELARARPDFRVFREALAKPEGVVKAIRVPGGGEHAHPQDDRRLQRVRQDVQGGRRAHRQAHRRRLRDGHRQVPRADRRGARGAAGTRSRATSCSSPPTPGRSPPGRSASCGTGSPATSTSSTRRPGSCSGSSTSRCSSTTTSGGRWVALHHPFTVAACPDQFDRPGDRSGAVHLGRLRPGVQRLGDRGRLDPYPPPGGPAEGVQPPRASGRRRRSRSSGSCSTRCGSALRRTAASPSASIVWSCCWSALTTSAT